MVGTFLDFLKCRLATNKAPNAEIHTKDSLFQIVVCKCKATLNNHTSIIYTTNLYTNNSMTLK